MAISFRLSLVSKTDNLRSFGAVIWLIVYLIGGALHGACGLALYGAAPSVACQTSDRSESPDPILPSHHCHGCFAVVMPVLEASAIAAPVGCELKWTAISADGLAPTLHTPPPKTLA
ncbi:MAG: hypothetical protein IJ935_11940 [Afipia sp.]|nr:hypothetical protein [Afipia sp.]